MLKLQAECAFSPNPKFSQKACEPPAKALAFRRKACESGGKAFESGGKACKFGGKAFDPRRVTACQPQKASFSCKKAPEPFQKASEACQKACDG